MANRYDRSRDRSQQDWNDDEYRPRQSEQFQSGSSQQYGDSARNYDYDDRTRGYEDNNRQSYASGNQRNWQGSGNRGSSQYDPLNQYDSYGSTDSQREYQQRQGAHHSTFRGDDYGAAQQAGPSVGSGSAYGFAGDYTGQPAGNFFNPNGPDYGRDRARGPGRHDHDRGFFERAGDEIASWFGDEDAERRREQDHRGRGPSGYKRSDERILEDTCDRLTEDRGVDARNITVTVDNGEVTLDGTVNTLWEKRRAEDCVHRISGAGHVQNNLRLAQTDMRAGSTQVVDTE